jgi:hypothetical protein
MGTSTWRESAAALCNASVDGTATMVRHVFVLSAIKYLYAILGKFDPNVDDLLFFM